MLGLLIGGQLVGRRNAAVQVPSFFPSQAQTGNGGVNSSGTGLPSAQAKAIANAIDPSVVDIDAQLGYQQAAAAGTGMILTSDGEILTNNHVIAGATSVTATVVGGKKYAVKILGTDPTDDVALIKLVGASGLPPITTGDPSKLTPGQPIVAVGNAGGVGGTPSVATGTVEDLDQSVTASDLGGGNSEQLSGLIEIDAPLEPGDSGGPLLTASRLVVGMDTAASSTGSVQSQTSIGFAIPINRAMAIAQQIAAGHGSATIQLGLPGFLGVSVFENNPTTTPGADIMSLLPGSPTGKAGLVAGDVITSIDGQAVTSPKNLTMVMTQHHPGEKVTVGYTDISGASQTATVTLITGPAA
jgi:S1-C subfamily serine protease